jgi:orotidine-5'-phosphate decarboxylase
VRRFATRTPPNSRSWRGDAQRIFDFCAAIVDAAADQVIAFKPQIADFAAHRAEDQLERLIAHIRQAAPRVPGDP